MTIELCTDISEVYKDRVIEEVNWSPVMKNEVDYKLQSIIHRAKIELKLLGLNYEKKFVEMEGQYNEDVSLYYGAYLDHYQEQQEYLSKMLNITPEPPGGLDKPIEVIFAGDKRYYLIRSLWDLKYLLDERKARYGCELVWRYCSYIKKPNAINNNNHEYVFDDYGRETRVKTEVYYVGDVKQYIRVQEGSIG